MNRPPNMFWHNILQEGPNELTLKKLQSNHSLLTYRSFTVSYTNSSLRILLKSDWQTHIWEKNTKEKRL